MANARPRLSRQEFTEEEEVKNALKLMPKDKAPGRTDSQSIFPKVLGDNENGGYVPNSHLS